MTRPVPSSRTHPAWALPWAAALLLAAGPLSGTGSAATPDEQARAAVLAFIEESEARLYDPVAEGLESLGFLISMPVQMGGGELRVRWDAESGAEFDVELGAMLRAQYPAERHAEIERSIGLDQGEELVRWVLHRPASRLAAVSDVTLEGVEDGLVKIRAVPRRRSAFAGVSERVLLFDDEGVLRKERATIRQAGQTVVMHVENHWRPLADDDDRLVLEAQTTETELMGGRLDSRTIFHYESRDGLLLMTGKTDRSMGMVTETVFEDLDVVRRAEEDEHADAADAESSGASATTAPAETTAAAPPEDT